MSEWGVIQAGIESVFRSTVPTIPAGESGVTSGLTPVDALDDGEYPHVWIGGFLENVIELTWLQKETTVSTVVLYADFKTQDDITLTADSLRDAVNADSSIGFVTAREIGEVPGKDLRVIRFEIESKEIA